MSQLADGADAAVVLVTVPTEEVGRGVARALVEERLAACGSVVPVAASIYRWKGEVLEEPEFLVILKTRVACLDALAARVTALHPHEVPEILALPVSAGLDAYLAWVREATTG
jgi:periplasmic divalent cation tolerance protein